MTPTAAAPTVTPKARPEPAITPSVTAEVAAAPAEVELTIEATPKGVEVWQGTQKLGTTAAPVKIKRADGKVKLTFKAPGYQPQDMEVAASASTVVPVTLKKIGGPGRRGELEF